MAAMNVAIVGCGQVAYSHFKAWKHIPFAKVLAICDLNKDRVEKAAQDWRIPQIFVSTANLADSKEVSVWDICTPIKTHTDLAIQAMNNGIDVLIEKPLAIDSSEAKKVVECQNKTGAVVGVIHNWLFEPPVLKARSIVESGKIGEIISAHMSVLHTKEESMTVNKDHWSHQLPGGRFSEMLIHPIYLFRHFLGEIKVEGVSVSKIGTYPWMAHDELYASFRAGEKLGGTYASFNAPRYAIFINLFGSKGIIMVDIINATVRVLPRVKLSRSNKVIDSLRQAFQLSTSMFSNGYKVLSGQWFDGHEMCIRLFARALAEKTKPPVTAEEALEVVKTLESVYKLFS